MQRLGERIWDAGNMQRGSEDEIAAGMGELLEVKAEASHRWRGR